MPYYNSWYRFFISDVELAQLHESERKLDKLRSDLSGVKVRPWPCYMQEVKILYEDTNILAVHKPAGLKVHGDGKNREETLVDWILNIHPELKEVGEPLMANDQLPMTIYRPGIVHRLDRETSGVLLIAKNQKSFTYLKGLFKERLIKKTYIAFVYGNMSRREGVVEKPIGRSAKTPSLWSASGNAQGKVREALTEYKVLSQGSEYACLEVRPKTGRTHQIRVHLKFLGHPVVCDTLYAKKRECPETLGRLGLHAYALEFRNEEGIELRLEAPLPEDMKQFLNKEFSDLQMVL